MITDKSLMAEWEKAVTAMSIRDYGPDDAVFTQAYGAPVKVKTKPSMPLARSPLKLLSDHSHAWPAYGVPCPDLVFQTAAQGLYFYRHCLSYSGATSRPPDVVDGMCIARVLGVNLIWPEK